MTVKFIFPDRDGLDFPTLKMDIDIQPMVGQYVFFQPEAGEKQVKFRVSNVEWSILKLSMHVCVLNVQLEQCYG